MDHRHSNVWFVGNSQLHSSLIQAFCTPEIYHQCSEDWKNGRVAKGAFKYDENSFNYLFCNMNHLGNPQYEGNSLNASENMIKFVGAVDPDATAIVVMLRGNEFAIESLVDTPVHWDFSDRDRPATKGRQLVRRRDMMAYLESRTNSLYASCLLYRVKFPKSKIFHVVAPPPIESEAHILGSPEIFGSLFEEYGVRPFHLRKKIYDMMYGILSENLHKIQVTQIFAPQETLTDSGGLKSEFASGCLHGNDMYGRALMLLLKRSHVYASV